MTKTHIPTAERLEKLGFVTAACEMEKHKDVISPELRKKLRTAFEFYRVVEPHHIARFNERLKKATMKVRRYIHRRYSGREIVTERNWMTLGFTRIHSYTAAPPAFVLDKLEEAKQRGCFDYYEVATLVLSSDRSVKVKYPDPILFGRIEHCDKYYFIAQWDDDVKIEDILSEEEG